MNGARALSTLAVATLLVAATGAALLATRPQADLTDSASEADRVTLYQSGLAFVELTRTFEATGGEMALHFPLPTSAIFESLRLEGDGVAVRELRSSLQDRRLLDVGDRVAAVLEGGARYEGTVLRFEGDGLLLATDEGSVLVRTENVLALEIASTAATAEPGAASATAVVVAEPGAREVRLTYLAQGAGWTPSYDLDADTGRLRFSATLTGLQDWRNVTLDLVAGSPHLVATPRPPHPETAAAGRAAFDVAVSEPEFGPSVPVGELHRYSLDRPIDLDRGQTIRLPVLEGDVEILRHYYRVDAGPGWGGGERDVPVPEVYEIRNPLDFLPGGVVHVYRDGAWVGEDRMEPTPEGGRANVTAALSHTVRARVVQESQTAGPERTTQAFSVIVGNTKEEAVDVRVSFAVPTYRTNVVSTEPQAEIRGGEVVWNAEIPPEASRTFRVTYETLRDR